VGGLTRTFEVRPLSSHAAVFEVAEADWSACVGAQGTLVAAAMAIEVGSGCSLSSVAHIRTGRTRYESYDEFSHPRRVVRERYAPGTTFPIRTTTREAFYDDYSGGPTYLGAVPFSVRAAAWLLDTPEFVQVTDTALVDGEPESRARVERMVWNERGELVAHVREPGLDPATPALGTPAPDEARARLTATFFRDAFGNIDRIERAAADGEVRFDDFGYDEDGIHLRWARNAAGHLSYVGIHPAFGTPVVAIDPNGVTDLYQYDGLGRLRQEAMAGGGGRSISYGNRTITVAPAGGGQAVLTFDRLGRLVRERSLGLGTTITSSRSFDSRGFVEEVLRPSTPTHRGAVVRPAFDQLGRPTSVHTQSSAGAPFVQRQAVR
jgi:YD repeat-containing protein